MFINLLLEYKNLKINPLKNLLLTKKRLSGRNNIGSIILLGRGSRKFIIKYRLIDFNRYILNIPGIILKFEYDPNRSSYIMLINFINGFFSYNLAPLKVKLNKFIINSTLINNSFILIGNNLNLFIVPVGTFIYNVKKISRSAGTYSVVLRKIGSFILLKLPSKEERFIYSNYFVTIGRISFELFKLRKYTSSSFLKRKGFKPKVRGVAKNPIDHPHGGGEGRTSGGQPSVSPWNIYTKGIRTTSRFKNISINKFRWGFLKRRTGAFW